MARRVSVSYIKECLAVRRRNLFDKYLSSQDKPQEIIDAEKALDEARKILKENNKIIWDWKSSQLTIHKKIEKQIDNKIRQVEEAMILGEENAELVTLLAELDNWTPVQE